jgi:hypothetical protein
MFLSNIIIENFNNLGAKVNGNVVNFFELLVQNTEYLILECAKYSFSSYLLFKIEYFLNISVLDSKTISESQ